MVRKPVILSHFQSAEGPAWLRQAVSSIFRAGDAQYYTPPVNFYQESVRCVKLTQVTHTSPISISWKAFDAVINRMTIIQWMVVHFTAGQTFYLPWNAPLVSCVDPGIGCFLRWGGGTRSFCVPRMSVMHVTLSRDKFTGGGGVHLW